MKKRGSRPTQIQRALLEGLTTLAKQEGIEVMTREVPNEMPSIDLSKQLTQLNDWEAIGRKVHLIVGEKVDYKNFLDYVNQTVGKFVEKIEQAHINAGNSTLTFRSGVYAT